MSTQKHWRFGVALALCVRLLAGAAPVFAQRPDHADVVTAVKADLDARHMDLAGACGAFEVVKRVAWQLRSEGAGLRAKAGGSGCVWQGVLYAADIVSYPDGTNVDMLIDAGGSNVPAWNVYPPDAAVIAFHRPALDPGDGPTPTPAGDATLAALGNLSLQVSDVQKVTNESRAKLDDLATHGDVQKLSDQIEAIRKQIQDELRALAPILQQTAAGRSLLCTLLRIGC